MAPQTMQTNMPSFFCAMQWPGSESPQLPQFAVLVIFYLLAGRVTAGMSLEHMYLVHPDSADTQAILVGGEAVILLKALLRFCLSAERGSEKRFFIHANMALQKIVFSSRDPEKRDLPHLLLPLVGFISSVGMCLGMHRRHALNLMFASKHHVAYIRGICRIE